MLYKLDGFAFSSESEYKAALEDKALIDKFKSAFDLNTVDGVKKAYVEIQSLHFKTALGDSFDDEVYELYEKAKNNPEVFLILSSSKPVKKKEAKTKKKIEPIHYDEKTKAELMTEIKRQQRKRTVLIISLLVISFISIGYFVKYYSDARAMQKATDDLNKLKDVKFAEILKNVEPVVKKDYSEGTVIPDILPEYLALYNKNKNLIGWVKIADTIIDYPVMQTSDNDYYLKHSFDGGNDANGCIFLDCKCDVILGNDNMILYGHHMQNGKMFSSLISYANEEFYEKHKTIEFDTIYEKGTYEVMFAFRSHIYNEDEIAFKYYQFIDASSEAEFDSNIEEMKKLSLIDTGVSAVYGDKLLTLSTCDYQEANGRFVVVAKRID